MSISQNRHERERLKAARCRYWGRDLRGDAKRLGKVATTPHPCACVFCVNRRARSGMTMQELRTELNYREQMEEAC